MLFSGKEMFSCVWLLQKMFRKIFFGIWLCSWKYHRKYIFYLLLTFSHIFLVAKRIYNIIHSSKTQTKPKKKSLNPDTSRDCDRLEGEIAIGAVLRAIAINASWSRRTISMDDFGGRSQRTISAIEALDDLDELFSLSLSLSRAWPRNGLKVKWKCKIIFGSKE